jgi:maleate isomerase
VWQRLGLIIPSSNTVSERDFLRGVPNGVTVHTGRAYMAETTVEAERRMLEDHVPQAALDLATAKVDLTVFSCTSAAALLGREGEAELVANLENLTGAPIVSTNDAVTQAIKQHDGARVAVVTAYIDDLNRAIASTLEENGLDVVSIAGMGITDNFAIGEVEPREIVSFTEHNVTEGEFDVLVVSCTNLRAVEAIPRLKERFGTPVITSNQAALDAAMAALGEPWVPA